MLHAAAKDVPYSCFVREDTTIPFMAMPDAITSLLQLWQMPRSELSRAVYNVTSFSLSAAEFKAQVIKNFPRAEIDFAPDLQRQSIVDSWPAGLNDKQARKDWGWEPAYDVTRAFEEYLVPSIRERYQ